MPEPTIYTPERVAEVRGHVAAFERRLTAPLEPWERQQVTASLADARAWLEEARLHGC